MRRPLLPLLLVAPLALLPGRFARAADVQIEAETIGQAYQLRSASDTLVNRRRLTEVLGLHIFNVGPKDVMGRPLPENQFYFTMAMRLDAELGGYSNLQELVGRTFQREIYQDRFELLYAYAGGRDVGGFVDFRLGRQIFLDLFEFRSLDGLAVDVKTPFHVALEAWGGFNVTGTGPFDSPVLRADGVALGGNAIDSLGARQEDALQPTFGFALQSIGLRDLQTRLSYLRTVSFTQSRQPAEPNSGVVEEQVAFTARGRMHHGALVPWFGLRYNLLVGRVDELQAGARARISAAHGVQVEYVFAAPTFDGDSIWNVFGSQAFNDLRLTYDVSLGRFLGYARGFVRFFGDETTSQSHTDPARVAGLSDSRAVGGGAGGRVALGRGYVRLDGYYEGGYRGLRAGADLSGRARVISESVGLEGRLSFVHFRDDVRPLDAADSFGAQAGIWYAFARGLVLHGVVEENANRFYSSQTRVLALLDISFFLGTRSAGGPRSRTGWF